MAAEMICFEYVGYCCATFAALENDFVSWFWTLVLTWELLGADSDGLGERSGVARGERARRGPTA